MSFQNAQIVARNVNSDEYHDIAIERGHPDYPVSPSMLKLFASSAAKWIEGYAPPDTKSRRWGNLLDCLLLTPKQFKVRYAVQPEQYESKGGEMKPWSNQATVCKEWNRDHEGMEVISHKEHLDASSAVMRLRKDTTLGAFIDQSEKQVWVSAKWHDEHTGLVIPVRCLIDLEPTAESEFAKCLGDIKSSRSAALRAFQRDAFNMGYHVQGAFNMDLYRAACPDRDITTWCLLVQENTSPWLPARRIMEDDPSQPDNMLDLGRVTYKRLLRNYCVCLQTKNWPDYDDNPGAVQGWSPLRAEVWMMDYLPDSMSLPKDEESEAEETSELPT